MAVGQIAVAKIAQLLSLREAAGYKHADLIALEGSLHEASWPGAPSGKLGTTGERGLSLTIEVVAGPIPSLGAFDALLSPECLSPSLISSTHSPHECPLRIECPQERVSLTREPACHSLPLRSPHGGIRVVLVSPRCHDMGHNPFAKAALSLRLRLHYASAVRWEVSYTVNPRNKFRPPIPTFRFRWNLTSSSGN